MCYSNLTVRFVAIRHGVLFDPNQFYATSCVNNVCLLNPREALYIPFQTASFSLALMLSGRRGTQTFHIDYGEVAYKMKALNAALLCHKILADGELHNCTRTLLPYVSV
jgi:hypothetical protein